MTTRNYFEPSLPENVEQVLYRNDMILVTSERIEARRSTARSAFTVTYNLEKISSVHVSNDAGESGTNWLGLICCVVLAAGFFVAGFLGVQKGVGSAWFMLGIGVLFCIFAFGILSLLFAKDVHYVFVEAIPNGLHLYPHHFIVYSSKNLTEAEKMMQDIEACCIRKRH